MTLKLGKLNRVLSIRDAWPHEERDFSPWLAEEDNLSELAFALGFGRGAFLLEQTEARIGDFRADIIARVGGADGDRILIENQFSQTNHDHLGKIATYAAGLDAKFVVWIAERIREEHRAALDWLNSITDDGHGFFGVELELWRIGDSPPAPRFNLVSRPNDWARTIADLTKPIGSGGSSATTCLPSGPLSRSALKADVLRCDRESRRLNRGRPSRSGEQGSSCRPLRARGINT